jgi:putative mRNA 3-end processing factor
MSDHCDYNELINMVVQSGAEQVYTIHGFVDEFAEDLRKRGISAQPLLVNSLDNFTL